MSRHILQRMAKGYVWPQGEPEEWHLRLADIISPVAVLATFREATVQGGRALWFRERQHMLAARGFLPALKQVFGFEPFLDAPAYTPQQRIDIVQNNKRGR